MINVVFVGGLYRVQCRNATGSIQKSAHEHLSDMTVEVKEDDVGSTNVGHDQLKGI